MLWGNDEKLIKKVPQIDLGELFNDESAFIFNYIILKIVLGGHDHDYGVRKVAIFLSFISNYLIKSKF